MERNRFPAKILLFGEYALVLGKSGLAIPFHGYSGSFEFESHSQGTDQMIIDASKENLFKFHNYIEKECNSFIDSDKLLVDIRNGLWFNSDIPINYGVGSSGALVAAIYANYARQKQSHISQLKSQLALIESFFHGSSSGTDPLVAYLNKAVHVINNEQIDILEMKHLKGQKHHILLVDTNIQAATGPLVQWFRKNMNEMQFKSLIDNVFVPINNTLIHQYIENKTPNFELLQQLSEFQLNHFNPMIPQHFIQHFEHGLSGRSFSLKLCGSGGGGYMLAFCENPSRATEYFQNHRIKTIII